MTASIDRMITDMAPLKQAKDQARTDLADAEQNLRDKQVAYDDACRVCADAESALQGALSERLGA